MGSTSEHPHGTNVAWSPANSSPFSPLTSVLVLCCFCWVVKETGAAGFRLDACKHIDRDFLREFVKTGRSTPGFERAFVVAEFWIDSYVKFLCVQCTLLLSRLFAQRSAPTIEKYMGLLNAPVSCGSPCSIFRRSGPAPVCRWSSPSAKPRRISIPYSSPIHSDALRSPCSMSLCITTSIVPSSKVIPTTYGRFLKAVLSLADRGTLSHLSTTMTPP